MATLNPYEAFAAVYLSHELRAQCSPLHRALFSLPFTPHKFNLIECFRGSGKSLVMSKMIPLAEMMLGVVGVKRIMIVSDTSDLTELMLKWIRDEYDKNSGIQQDFPGYERLVWNADYIHMRRPDRTEIEILARGKGKQVRGYRPDWIIADDMENDESVRSADQRQKDDDWFHAALLNSLTPDGKIFMPGTPISRQALLSKLKQHPDWNVLSFPAKSMETSPDGLNSQWVALWPEWWPMSRLDEQEKLIGRDRFLAEFMLQPMDTHNPIFYRDHILWYDSKSPQWQALAAKGLYTVQCVDPAISQKDTADFTAIATASASYDTEPNFYIRSIPRDRLMLHETVYRMVSLAKEYKAAQIGVEVVAYQKALGDEFNRYCRDNHLAYPVTVIEPDKDKARRAQVVVPLFANGRVFWDKSDPGQRAAIEEMLLFTGTSKDEHDDMTDAVVMALTMLMQWGGRRKAQEPVESGIGGSW